MEWNEEAIARLRLLWAEGLSTAEIGRRMGISKNAVVGKAHRLLLAPRPSPIRRDADAGRASRAAAPRRVTGPTLPSLAVAPAMAPAPRPDQVAKLPPAAPAVPGLPVRPPPPMVTALPEPLARSLRPISAPAHGDRRRPVACCWPIGEPGTRSFRFCDAESLGGKPYCAAHAALAYVKVRDRREDAA